MRDERAAQELDDPADKQLTLCAVEARDLARGLPDVLDVGEQLFVLSSERLCGTHFNLTFPSITSASTILSLRDWSAGSEHLRDKEADQSSAAEPPPTSSNLQNCQCAVVWSPLWSLGLRDEHRM